MVMVIVLALATACFMELWAALLHGQVWHRLLWRIHRTHHARRRGRFELNDALSILHAPIAIVLIVHGCRAPSDVTFGIGLGMSLFGVAYVLVHDGLVHGRLPVGFLARIPYLRRVRDAHRVHHATGGAPFGLFTGPFTRRRQGWSPSGASGRRPGRAAPRGTRSGEGARSAAGRTPARTRSSGP